MKVPDPPGSGKGAANGKGVIVRCGLKEAGGKPLACTMLHKCCAQTLLELSADKKYLGAQPGIIQVLHTWNQELDYHVHMHCIISGGGLTTDRKIRKSSAKFFIPVMVLRDKFKGKYLAGLDTLYRQGRLVFSSSCTAWKGKEEWKAINYPGASTQVLCSAPTSPLTALAFRPCIRKDESGV